MFSLSKPLVHLLCTIAKPVRIALPNCGLRLTLALTIPTAIAPQPLMAQIVPDTTLPQNSIVNNNTITGGTTSGTALFHSFQDFSIPTGTSATFLPDAPIQTIILRVTGKQRSLIDGLLAVNGTANLFLLNPNGISFGRNAQLGINGSLIASTADSFLFADGSEFSARTPQAPPLLTVSTPIGLQVGTRPGSIVNQASLSVVPGQTLGLAGGEISLESGSLNSFGGTIFLVSAMSPGTIRLLPNATGVSLGETSLPQFGNIELSGTASANASGLGGGAIQIQGNALTLRDRATIFSDTIGAIDGQDIEIQTNQFRLQDRAIVRAFTIGTGAAGNVTIRATGTITLTGTGYEAFEQNYLRAGFDRSVQSSALESAILAGTFGAGRAGNLTIEAQQLSLSEGAVIGSPTQGAGAGGNLSIRVAGAIEVSSSGIGTTAGNFGKAGNLSIQAGSLRLNNTGIVTTNTLGDGDSGNLIINATDAVIVSGFVRPGFVGSNISTSSLLGRGNAGNLEINARRIQVENGGVIESANGGIISGRAFVGSGAGGNLMLNAADEIRLEGIGLNRGFASIISTSTFGSEKAGNIRLNTHRLVSRGQSLIVASTFGSEQGGTITINASESIQIEGSSDDGFGIGTNSGKLAFQRLFGLPLATGAAGDVRVFTPRLSIQDQGTISVGSLGRGNAGSILVDADVIELDRASINATTNSGGKGNIDLRSQLILLRNGSRITTDAGRADGGNIDIKARVLAAIPTENSDITANAGRRGGNINITAEGIIGLRQSPTLTARSDITASSASGVDGVVNLSAFRTEPQVTPALPTVAIESPAQIAQSCASFAKTGQFVITERGGLEPTTSEWAQSTPTWVDERGETTSGGGTISKKLSEVDEIVEATGWIRQPDGSIALVADEPNYPQTAMNCSTSMGALK